jgi:hypothetical protein
MYVNLFGQQETAQIHPASKYTGWEQYCKGYKGNNNEQVT